MKISQCLIVKNEVNNIEKCLSNLKGIVNEQIVIDTGSDDGTPELAKKLGAKVFFFKWVDDFSAPRNFALSKAKGDWIVFLDADECLDKPETLKDIILKHKDSIAILTPFVNFDDFGNVIGTTKCVRIFKNRCNLKYSGKIHEYLSIKGKEGIAASIEDDIKVNHTGYSESELARKQTHERNRRMLQEAAEAGNPSALYYMGNALSGQERFEEANDCYIRSLQQTDKMDKTLVIRCYSELLNNICMDNPEDEDVIMKYYSAAIEYEPGFPDYEYEIGIFYMNNKRYADMCEHFETALKYLKEYKGLGVVHVMEKVNGMCEAMLRCGRAMEDEELILRYIIILLSWAKDRFELLCEGVEIMKNMGMFLGQVEDILAVAYDLDEQEDRQFVAQAAQKVGFDELSSRLS